LASSFMPGCSCTTIIICCWRSNLAGLYQQQGRTNDALTQWRELLDGHRAALPGDQPVWANSTTFFFWTFDAKNVPDAQLRILEKMFGDWLVKKYSSLDAALAAWKGQKVNRDAPAEGRVSFRPLWNVFNEKTARDQDTAAFLFEVQTRFYEDTIAFLRQLGFKGLITPSNWATASPEVFGPLEKLSYATGDFIDRHGYFECNHKGENAAWSIRNGHTYSDRSALRFDAPDPTKARQFVHPVMDPHYAGKPSMISETTFCRPNRYRSEAPLYFAAYGALQDSDAIVHFALDSSRWAVKPGFWMQPWTLMTPVMMGQFPAAALIYRRGLVSAGQVLAEVKLNKTDLLHLKGTPLPQDAALDELRLADAPRNAAVKPGQRIDPLIHYAGRVDVSFVSEPGSTKVADLAPFVDHAKRTVTGSDTDEYHDYPTRSPCLEPSAGWLLAESRFRKLSLARSFARCPLRLAAPGELTFQIGVHRRLLPRGQPKIAEHLRGLHHLAGNQFVARRCRSFQAREFVVFLQLI
jgi:hypothetical protein